uniref:Uncharacterized protein n=1 Tax=Arundo donax TaxID=35708 RepID=A0A0A9CDU5_ARUDO
MAALAPDLRVYGDSRAPADPATYSILHLVGDVVALLDHLRLPKMPPFYMISSIGFRQITSPCHRERLTSLVVRGIIHHHGHLPSLRRAIIQLPSSGLISKIYTTGARRWRGTSPYSGRIGSAPSSPWECRTSLDTLAR